MFAIASHFCLFVLLSKFVSSCTVDFAYTRSHDQRHQFIELKIVVITEMMSNDTQLKIDSIDSIRCPTITQD